MSDKKESAADQLLIPSGASALPGDAAVPEQVADVPADAIWRQTRREIAERYCRVVTVIDDDIEVSDAPMLEGDRGVGSGPVISQRFWQLRKGFQDRKILCHLHTYPKTDMASDHPNAEPLIEAAAIMAAAANVVVLDWHLGKPGEGSDHAEAVLEKLLDSGELRFVILNSNDEPSRIRDRLIEIPIAGLAFADAADVPEGTIGARLGTRLFVLIRKKSEITEAEADAETLVQQVFSWMETTFPDQLHWAGLELSARVAEILPRVLGALPRATDVPLFHQWLFNEDLETNEQVVAFLLDELGLQFGLHPLAALDEECVKERITGRMTALAAKGILEGPLAGKLTKDVDGLKAALRKHVAGEKVDAQYQAVAPLIHELPETWKTECIRQARNRADKDWMRHFPGPKPKDSTSQARVAAYLEEAFGTSEPAYIAWSALYESTLCDLGSPKRLFTGFVLKRSGDGDNQPDWLLCVTPSCDCRWENVETYAFLPGRETADSSGSQTRVVTCVNTVGDGAKTIAWNPRKIVLKKKSDTGALIDDYILVGSMRPLHAMRIAQRTWNHQMRIGVDVPEYTRIRRKEGDL